MNGNRPGNRTRFVIVAIALLLVLSLGGLYLRSFIVTGVERDIQRAEPDLQEPNTPAEPTTPVPSSEERRGATELAGKHSLASFPFAQYDQQPTGYVGTAECASCHKQQHQSYLLTHHSRSLREVDPQQEGSGQTLTHRPSMQSYDVISHDGELWHRQWRHFSGTPGDRMKLGDYRVCYVMGSGAFGKAYLLGDGDYLLQSPVTWYAGSDALGMAPGYDRPFHVGMTRVITSECMYCHAGLLTQRNDNPDHLAIHELSIGCERCHGPGEAHARLYRRLEAGEVDAPAKEFDSKIIHPGKLDRRRLESICGQCHLHGDIVVYPPGGQVWDFVPGQDFAQTRLHYKHDKPGDFKDSFTGHFDQMWQSECYLQSETLTCVTCHNPHQGERIADRAQWRREQCNRCHREGQNQHCGLPLQERIASAENSCIECHMPSIETDVPHTSTTNHLIAIYDEGKPRGIEPASSESIRRVEVSPQISEPLLRRADALAAAQWAVQQAREGDLSWLKSPTHDDRLLEILETDPDDADVHSLLAWSFRLKADQLAGNERATEGADPEVLWDKVARHAGKALKLEKRPVEPRLVALEALANQQMYAGDYADAAQTLGELIQMRRSAVDWYNLGLCYGKLQRISAAEAAFREAIRLDGTYASPYRSLSILYRRIDPAVSRQLAEIAQRMRLQP